MARSTTGITAGRVHGGSPRKGRAGHGPRLSMALLLALVALAATLGVASPSASADTGDVGLEGPSHAGTGTPTGTKRSESVLWFNAGTWWGNLWDSVSKDFHIFRFASSSQTWVDTGVTTETRADTHHDVLWDGTTLFVSSHRFVNDGVAAAPGFPSTLRRYRYDALTDSYSLLSSTQINNYRTETLAIDKDSTGRVWATWQQDNQIYLNVTGTDGATWGTPFPVSGGGVSLDDTSSLIAFGSGRMGLMWSRQAGDATDGFYWSVHLDGDASGTWSTPQGIMLGAKSGDDHMNLKWLDSSGGRVFAAVKTSFTGSTQPLIQLFSRDSSGTWSRNTIATVGECPNRVVVLIDEGAQLLRTFATYPKPSGTTNAGTCTTSGGAIYEKSTPLSSISFTTTKVARIVDADQYVHNVSSTKQNLNSAARGTANSGVLVVADVNATARYWSFYEAGAGTPPPPGDTTPPETTIASGPSGSGTATDASFTFTSSEPAGATFECRLDGAPYQACASPASYTGLAVGTHTFEVRAKDAAGNTDASPATWSWTITSPPPPGNGVVRQSFSLKTNTAKSSTLQIDRPAGVTAGDVLVGCLSLSGGTVAATGVPAGWTTLAAVTSIANPKVYGYYKVATTSDESATSYTWKTSSTLSGGVLARYTGSSGPDASAASAAGPAATSGTVPQVSPSTAGAMLVGCMSANSSSVSLTSPAGMSEVGEAGNRRLELADGVQAAAGPSGTKTWTFNAPREWAGWLVALRPS